MSPEVISQASYSTILTVAFDLRHRLEYLSFSDRELSLFTYGFVNILYSEKRCCEFCGGHGAGHLPTRSDEVNLSAYVVENGIVGRVEGECVRCGGYYLHFSCDDATIPTLDESMRIYGLQMKYYALKIVHQELIHDMMDLILLEAMEGESSRSDGYSAIASFMIATAKCVSDMWCDPESRELRQRKFDLLRREALFGSDHQPVLPAQAYESYLEPYEIVVKSFVENRIVVENALDLIQEALIDNPSEGNFLMMLGVAMMYINRFQDYIKAYSPRSYMTPNDPLYKRIKQQFLSTDLGIIRRIPVVLMLYDMPRFYHYAYFKDVVEGKKVALSSEAIELCDCLIRQGRVLQNDLQKRTRKGKDELMRQQLRIRDIWLGQTELEDLPRQFVHYFSQREEAAKLPLALKALHLEERVVRLDLAQSRGAPPTIIIDCGRLPPDALRPPKSASSRVVTEARQPLDEARKQRIESYLMKIRHKKAPDKRDPFEDDLYSVPVDPKIVEQYTGKPIEEFRGGSKIEARSSGARKKQSGESSGSERQKKVEVKGSVAVDSKGGGRQSSATRMSSDVGATCMEEAGAEELQQDGRQHTEIKVVESTEQVNTAAKTVPEGSVPEGSPEGSVPEGLVPEGSVPEGSVPEGSLEGLVPEGSVPEGSVPEGSVPEGSPEGSVPEGSVQGAADSTAATESGEKDGGQQLEEVELPKEETTAPVETMSEQLQDSSEGGSRVTAGQKGREGKGEEDLGSPGDTDNPPVTQETEVGRMSLGEKEEVVGKDPDALGEEEGDGSGEERGEKMSFPIAVKQPLRDISDLENADEKASLSSEVAADSPLERPQSPGSARRKPGRSCAHCDEAPEKLQRCKACKVVYYCNAECQRLHWRVHKAECKKQ